MVVEADESDGTFNRLPATIAIVTNIDPEHMEHWGTIENLRQGFLRLRVEHPVLRPGGLLHRPPRGAGAGRPDHRPPRRDLRLQRAGRRARGRTCATRRASPISTSRLQAEDDGDRGLHPADAGRPQRLERAGGGRRGAAPRHEEGRDPRRAGQASAASTAASPGGRGERRDDHRRLRPPPGRDRRGAEGRAAGDARAG